MNYLEQRTLDALVRLSESRDHSERCMFVFPTNLMVASLSNSELGGADLITDDVVTMVCACDA